MIWSRLGDTLIPTFPQKINCIEKIEIPKEHRSNVKNIFYLFFFRLKNPNVTSNSKINLTGDNQIDADITAFMIARKRIMSSQKTFSKCIFKNNISLYLNYF